MLNLLIVSAVIIAGFCLVILEFKRIKDTAGRFVVVDNSDVLVMIKDFEEVHPNYDTGIWMSSPMLANSLGKTFEKI